MRSLGKSKVLGWGVAVATVVALATAGTVYASTQSTPLALNSAQMRSVLVPLAEQPPDSVLYGEPMTLKDAAANGGFSDPTGMTFAPKSCSTYLEDALGPMDSLDGWMQYGARGNGGGHADYFFQQVVNIPGGADLEKVRAAALTCSLGFMTLSDGFTGAVRAKERPAPSMSGASSLAVRHITQFRQPHNAQEQALLQEIGYVCEIGDDVCTECPAETVFLASGNLLIISSDTNGTYADQLATTMLDNARALPTSTSTTPSPLS